VKKITGFLLGCCMALIAGCDLQPRIMSLPDSVGDFISSRYPALLADPETQPEIYNSAASDYGVYASPELYGSVDSDDYIMYADINDYMFPAQPADSAPVPVASNAGVDDVPDEDVPALIVGEYHAPSVAVATSRESATDDVLVVPMYGGATDAHVITVGAGDTLYAIGRRYGTTVEDIARMNSMSAPYAVKKGQTLRVPGNGDIVVVADKAPAPAKTTATQKTTSSSAVSAPDKSQTVKAPTPARVQLQTVTVGPGDTLYSISRKYSVPVNDLAVMNDLGVPFRLTVGQKLRVPNLQAAAEKTAVASVPAKSSTATPKGNDVTVKKSETKKEAPAPKQKISSDPKQKLPKIAARSSSKFSWPVRGKILSGFGTKPNGLVNDGINISAARGTAVRAAENGVVAYAGNEVKGMGNLIIIQHSGGWMTVYAHLDSMALRRGARVNVGQKIGTVGATGKVDRPQLHFEIRKGTKAYNPSQYLKK